MMYRVMISNTISAVVKVDIPDDIEPDDRVGYVYEHADMPTLCAHCSGWGKPHSMELDGEWEIYEETVDGKAIPQIIPIARKDG